MGDLEFSRVDAERHELVFLRREGRGKWFENQYVCAVSFRGDDGLVHICDLDLVHSGPCYCDVHRMIEDKPVDV